MVMGKIIVLGLFLTFSGNAIEAESPCAEGWDVYGNDKCLKVINDILKNYDDAILACKGIDTSSTLLTIKSAEEQKFIIELIYKKNKIVDEIWIGAKNRSKNFIWADGSELSYTNWAQGFPLTVPDKACVQMISEDPITGKWVNTPCTKKNLVVCQMIQTWSQTKVQERLLYALKEIKKLNDVGQQLTLAKNQLNFAQQALSAAKKEMSMLKMNPVPIGFIYVQFANQPEPEKLWPLINWTDVTTAYAGLSFRAEGNGSLSHEKIQEANSPRLAKVKSHLGGISNDVDVVPGQWTKQIYTGSHSGSADSLASNVSPGEVRRRNQAIRIWKRIN